MKYTQQQLESMRDFELNVVAANQFYDGICITTSPSKHGVEVNIDDVCIDDSYNPCERWDDCGNLIDECGISIDYYSENTYDGNNPCAVKWMPYGYVGCTDKNPKRAVTIVYILVKQDNE